MPSEAGLMRTSIGPRRLPPQADNWLSRGRTEKWHRNVGWRVGRVATSGVNTREPRINSRLAIFCRDDDDRPSKAHRRKPRLGILSACPEPA